MTSPGCYHLLLACEGRPLRHGWWGSEETARRKFSRWVGEYGSIPVVRVTLADEETGERLAVWPDDPGRIFMIRTRRGRGIATQEQCPADPQVRVVFVMRSRVD
ncbi:hypothetical protein [Streptomyces sp. NPDC001153]